MAAWNFDSNSGNAAVFMDVGSRGDMRLCAGTALEGLKVKCCWCGGHGDDG